MTRMDRVPRGGILRYGRWLVVSRSAHSKSDYNSSKSRTNVLVLNAGSSSVKYGLFSLASRPAGDDWLPKDSTILASGSINHIGSAGNKPIAVTHWMPGKNFKYNTAAIKDHYGAFSEAMKLLTDPVQGAISTMSDISIVGHRVTHGGELSKAQVIDSEHMTIIRNSSHLAPLHNPANINGIEIAQAALGSAKHVAVFDTAFHQTMPPESYTYGIPKQLALEHGIRRYGFHGTSFKFVLQSIADELGRQESELNLIICHLGSGASMACIERGRCIDTTMGLTPLEGMIMGTRCGDLDPGVVLHLTEAVGIPPEEVNRILNKESGLAGICGLSDMRDVEVAASSGNEDAILAEKVYVQRIRKYLGSFLVRLNGNVDALAFTGGVGENSARIRHQICEGLQRFGISLDPAKNVKDLSSERDISTAQSFSKIFVIPANEELAIALQSMGAVARPALLAAHGAAAAAAAAAEARRAEDGLLGLSAAADDEDPDGGGGTPTVDSLMLSGAAGLYMASHNFDHMTDPLIAQVGLMYTIMPKVQDVGYFRPFVQDQRDKRIQLMREVFNIKDPVESMYGVTTTEAAALLADDKEDQLLAKIVSKYLFYKRGHGFVIVGGNDSHDLSADWPTTIDTKVAGALNLPIVWATNVAANPVPGEKDDSLVKRIVETVNAIKPKGDLQHVRMAGVIMTDVPDSKIASLGSQAKEALAQDNVHLIAAVPSHRKLQMRTVRDIGAALGAKIVFSKSVSSLDSIHVGSILIATVSVDQLISSIRKHATNVDRIVSTAISEARVAAFQAEFAKFDRDGSGRIRAKDIGNVMGSIGYHPSERWLRSTVAEVDRTGVGNVLIDFQTFLQLILHRRESEAMGESSPLVVTNAGRADVLLSLLLASLSANFPRIAGIVLTGAPDESALPAGVADILHGLDVVGVPVLCVALDTFSATVRMIGPHGLHPPRLGPVSNVKLQVVSEIFTKSTCPLFIDELLRGRAVRQEMTSHIFQHLIVVKAKSRRQRIVLPEGEDWRVVTAAGDLLARELCEVILLGDPDAVRALARKHHVRLDGATIILPSAARDVAEMASVLSVIRQSKGMTPEMATELLHKDYTWYGTMMMYLGKADGMVSGAVHTTADTMRPALQVIKTSPGFSLVSSIFFMLLPDRVYVFGDCAINVEPTAEELAQIAVASAESAEAFGIQPRVAMISYATGNSNTGPIVDKVRHATQLARKMKPGLLIEGPIQFDAAVHPDVAAVKYKGTESQVAGRATVCIFPDLNTGNTTYKAVQQATKCLAIGPIMQGLRKPVNDLSRGCTVKDIVNTVLITCVQAHSAKLSDPTAYSQ